MNQKNLLLKNSILNVWLQSLKNAEKYPKFDLVDNVISAFYNQIKDGNINKVLPQSFDSLKEANIFIKENYSSLFEKIDYAKKRSASHLVSAKIKQDCNLPVLIEKSELVKYSNVFEIAMIKELEKHSKRFILLDLPPAASIMFKPISSKKALGTNGINISGEFIIGIDLASGLQEICFYHNVLKYPVSVAVSMNELFVYVQRSHQNLFIISETCSCISKLNDVIEVINSKNTKIKHSYIAVKNSSLNHLKSRDSKNDQIDATVLYVKGHTPKNLLPHSLISDKYCAEGKMLSRSLKTHQESLQKYVTELKNTILEYTGLPISPNANADDTCREAVCIVLSNILETKGCAHIALRQQGDKDLDLIQAIKSLELIDDKTLDEYIQIAKSKKETKPTPQEAKELKLFGTKKKKPLASAYIEHPGYKDLDLEYYEELSPTGHISHKTPTLKFKQEEIISLMSYANLFSIISLIQVIQNISVLIDDITTTISELIVPSNMAMSAACEIPSIGPMQAFELTITLGDVSRFPTASDALSFLGVVPSVAHTGHKKGCSKRLSNKGRKSVKKSLYLGQIAHSTRNHFNIKKASCSVWKNIAHSVSIFYSMMKNNKKYMPLKNKQGHNEILFKQFSKVKSPLITENKCKKKPIALLGKRLTVLYKELHKIKTIRNIHSTLDEGYKSAQDFENEWVGNSDNFIQLIRPSLNT